MKILVIFFALFLSACSSNLPNKERTLDEFIPEEKTETITPKKDFDFTARKFPEHCDWKILKRVVDGDTLIVGEDIRVRLIGIDTPETKHPKKPIQKFGLESSAKMESLLQDQEKVCLIADEAGDDFDEYGRRLAYIYREDGLDINGALLKSGLARGYFYFPFTRKTEFEMYEKEARAAKLNLWE